MVNEDMKIKGLVTVEIVRVDGTREILAENKPNLLTNSGRDWIHGQVYNTGTTNQAKYIGLTTDAGAANAADTTLTGEISTNGLTRVAGTPSHSGGTNTTTITAAFTAAGSFTAVQKTALFTQVSGGTMVHENTFTSVNMQSGDVLNVTWTITAG